MTVKEELNAIWAPVIEAMVHVELAVSKGTIKRKAVREQLEAELLKAHRAARKAAPELPMPPSIELLKDCDQCEEVHLRLNLQRHMASGEHLCDQCAKTRPGRKKRAEMYPAPICVGYTSNEEYVEGHNEFFRRTGWTIDTMNESKPLQDVCQTMNAFDSGAISLERAMAIVKKAFIRAKREGDAWEKRELVA